MSEPAAKPWDRLPNEPSLWYARFDAYRLLGPTRTIEAAFREEKGEKGKCPARWYTESKNWRWRERAELWDAHERPNVQRQRLEELDAARARHRKIAMLQQQKALEFFNSLNSLLLTPSEARLLLADGIELERRSIEEPIVAELVRDVGELKQELQKGQQ